MMPCFVNITTIKVTENNLNRNIRVEKNPQKIFLKGNLAIHAETCRN